MCWGGGGGASGVAQVGWADRVVIAHTCVPLSAAPTPPTPYPHPSPRVVGAVGGEQGRENGVGFSQNGRHLLIK